MFASGVLVGSNKAMDNNFTTPVSIATADMCGWWVEMRSTGFALWGPRSAAIERRSYFQRCALGYRFPAADVEAARAAMVQASRWFRKEWRPDFAEATPYGLDRGVSAHRVGEWIELRCTDFAETGAETDLLEFSYSELPGLRASIGRRARPRRKRLTKERHVTQQP